MNETFADYFRERGSARRAAIATGIPYITLRKHITGTRMITMKTAERYHRLLGIPYECMTPDRQISSDDGRE